MLTPSESALRAWAPNPSLWPSDTGESGSTYESPGSARESDSDESESAGESDGLAADAGASPAAGPGPGSGSACARRSGGGGVSRDPAA